MLDEQEEKWLEVDGEHFAVAEDEVAEHAVEGERAGEGAVATDKLIERRTRSNATKSLWM